MTLRTCLHGPWRGATRVVLVGLLTVLFGCGPAQPTPSTTTSQPHEPSRPNLLRIAATVDVSVFHDRLRPTNDNDWDNFVNGGLAVVDDKGVFRPMLLERLPSQDDGTWTVNPDGTMKTILTLRKDLKWQDGHPLTAADIAFAFRVYTDREVPMLSTIPERYISSVVAVDDQTAEVSWKQTFVEAGTPAKNHLAPLPRHLLVDLYEQDKKAFLASPFWTTEQYVGTGPFTVVSRDPGVRVVMQANPYFVFGKPTIDAIHWNVVPDRQAIVVRLLAGDVDFAEYRSIQAETAQLLGEQWKANGAGQVYSGLQGVRDVWFQRRDVAGHQKAILDLRVRQAFMHAIDRESLGRSETAGLAGAGDTPYPPTDVLFPRVDRVLTKYPFDLQRAEALLREAGWTRGPDGLQRDSRGEVLDIEVTASSDHPREPLVIADFVKRAGFNARPIPLTEEQEADAEFRASFPGASVSSGQPGMYTRVWGQNVAVAATGWRGQNRMGYVNPQLDALIDRLDRTIQQSARDDLNVEMEGLISADVALGHLYYTVRPAVATIALKGITGLAGSYSWNVWEWRFE